jgi:N6-L-threonylcarbamoyladenine synthase
MRILGIESSCDDTSVALLLKTDDGFRIIKEKTASQIDIHKKYGGVIPEIAGRKHAEQIIPLIEHILEGEERPDLIAVTSGPGLITGLLVGIEAARSLAYAWNIPLVGVNHIDGHLHSVELEQPIQFPALALVVSGGHTELILMRDHGDYTKIGKTRDDAVGECFDKCAKMLGFDYPGGPKISKIGKTGNPSAIPFPRPMMKDKNYDFSFAGLKTAALYYVRDHPLTAVSVNPLAGLPTGITGQAVQEPTEADFCASVEQAMIDVLIEKTMRAVKEYQPKSVLLVGGVSANTKLRDTLQANLQESAPDTLCLLSPKTHSMDNGAMIAMAGYHLYTKKGPTDWTTLSPERSPRGTSGTPSPPPESPWPSCR